MIKYFKEVEGRYIQKIIGQNRLAFAHSDTSDFYDLAEWARAGDYPGSIILFYDFSTGSVYKPFEKKRNVIYSDPIYAEGAYYFMQGDHDEKKITLYRYLPEEVPEKVTELNIEEVRLYNLRIIGESVYIISQDERFECYYPEKFAFPLEENESAIFIEDRKVYLQAWFEDQDKYYEKVIVKDYKGTTLSEEVGSVYRAEDGTWWIA